MSQSLRVLIVEDRQLDAMLAVAHLRQAGFDVDWHRVDRPDAFQDALREPFDVILCDYSMPDFHALQAIKLWRDHGSDIPFLVVSGSIGEEVAVETMKAGAWDYLLKDRLTRLGQAVNRCLQLRNERRKHRETERILRLHQRAVEASAQGFVVVDAQQPDMPILFVNSAFTRITGYPSEEAVGRNCRFLQGPETAPETVRQLRQSIREGRACSVEILNYRRDGIPFWNHLSISPVHDADGQMTHYVGVQVDVTERRSLERQLLQSQKMEAIGRLAGGIAHDFNNLLTIILGYSEILQELDPTSEQSPLIQNIRDAGERAVSLTRQLLLFSRRNSSSPEVFELNEVTVALEKMLKRIIGEDIRLRTDLTPVSCQIKADPSQVEQVILNLAINARDAMPNGGQLTIKTRFQESPPESSDGGWVILTVADTGCGMTDEVRAKIFEPFFTTKEVDKGTGLGLAIVFGVVNQSGGMIRVTSAPGKGTTFEVLWPAAEPELSDEAIQHGESPIPGGSETILLVEDQEQMRSLGRLALESAGYRVIEAVNAPEAIERSRSFPGKIDLVVADLVMPEMTGRQLARALAGQRGDTRTLLVSELSEASRPNSHFDSSQENCVLLEKPYTSVSLAKKVREVLDN
jgi:two-component system, cell cycle sensor histidine kinase and response regulator CckA